MHGNNMPQGFRAQQQTGFQQVQQQQQLQQQQQQLQQQQQQQQQQQSGNFGGSGLFGSGGANEERQSRMPFASGETEDVAAGLWGGAPPEEPWQRVSGPGPGEPPQPMWPQDPGQGQTEELFEGWRGPDESQGGQRGQGGGNVPRPSQGRGQNLGLQQQQHMQQQMHQNEQQRLREQRAGNFSDAFSRLDTGDGNGPGHDAGGVPHATGDIGQERPRQKQKLHVGGLSRGTVEADLEQHFAQFGEVFEAFIPFAESQRTKKFYGFVKISIDGARAALTCDEHVIAGRDIATVSLVGSAPDEPAKGEATGESQANPSDLSADPYYRTKLCKNYLERGSCPYEDRCWFAHGEAQLRPSDPAAGIGGHSSGRFAPPPEIRPSTTTHTTQGNRARNSNMSAICVPGGSERKMVDQAYRTKLCTHWEAGNCQYGDSCIFAHGAAGLRIFGEDEAGTYPPSPRCFTTTRPRNRSCQGNAHRVGRLDCK